MSKHGAERKRPTASAPSTDTRTIKRVQQLAKPKTLPDVAVSHVFPAATNMQQLHRILHASEDLTHAVAHLSAADNREWPL